MKGSLLYFSGILLLGCLGDSLFVNHPRPQCTSCDVLADVEDDRMSRIANVAGCAGFCNPNSRKPQTEDSPQPNLSELYPIITYDR